MYHRSRVFLMVGVLAMLVALPTDSLALHYKLYKAGRPFDGLRSTDTSDKAVYNIKQGCYYEKLETVNGQVTLEFVDVKVTDTNGTRVVERCADGQCKKEKLQLVVAESVLAEDPLNCVFAEGVAGGVLALPLKLRFKTDDAPYSFNTSASIGPYVGYQLSSGTHFTHTVFVFGGLTIIPISDINAKEVENASGGSIGGGIVTNIAGLLDNLQIGAVVGADFLGGNRGRAWVYEGKPWLSFSIGFQFLK